MSRLWSESALPGLVALPLSSRTLDADEEAGFGHVGLVLSLPLLGVIFCVFFRLVVPARPGSARPVAERNAWAPGGLRSGRQDQLETVQKVLSA